MAGDAPPPNMDAWDHRIVRWAGMEPVIEAFKRDVDRTILRENLKLTPEQRVLELMETLRAAEEFERAGRELRHEP